MPETAEEIRAAVLTDEWCPACSKLVAVGDECCGSQARTPPLFDRVAGVPGLEWDEDVALWFLRVTSPACFRIDAEHAAALIGWHLGPMLAKAAEATGHANAQKAWAWYLFQAQASDTPVRDLAAMCHRWKDGQEQNDVHA